EITLAELTGTEAELLVASRIRRLYGDGVTSSPTLLGSLIARAGGNPFYLEELTSLVYARGVDPGDGDAPVELPDTLRSLLTAGRDQLGEGEQAPVKVASVIGQVFPASWVWGAYPELGGPDSVRAHLDRLSSRDLTTVRNTEPEPEYEFRHVLTQEAAYAT